ncbi:MAG: type IV pilus secretin PilQ [Nitrospirota bacterium]
MTQKLEVRSHKVKDKKKSKRKYLRLHLLSFMIFCSLFFAIWGCATTSGIKESAQPEETPVITGIDLQDNSVTIRVSKPFSYTMYRPDDPYKVVVELLDVNTGAFNMKIISDKAGVTEIVPYQVKSPSLLTRLEILLQMPSEVEPEYQDNELKIKLKGGVPKEVFKEDVPQQEVRKVAEIKEPEPATPEPEEIPLPKATEITSISFERVADKINVLIKGNGSMDPSVFNLDNRIVIDVPDIAVSAPLPTEVVSPVKGIRLGKYDGKTRIVIDLKEKIDFDITTIRDSIVLALMLPIAERIKEEKVEVSEAKEEAETPVQGKYPGKKISLDFQDADIVPIFRLLADISGYNIVVSPEVKGKLTMKLINVPWDQALDIILKTFSLGKSFEGNIIRIAPHTVFARESDEAVKAKESELKAISLETKIFPISYGDVTVVEKAIKDSKMLSPRGSISTDKRTSSLTIYDVAAVFPQVENLLITLDKPTPQVLIETRIVEVSTKDVQNLGIQWGIGHPTGSKPFRGLTGLGTLSSPPFTGDNFLVDFPAAEVGAGSGAGIAFGILNTTRTAGLDLQLSALQTIGKSRIITSPRVVTTDNEKAVISQGISRPFPKVDVASGQISVEYKDIAITTEVTPHITPAGSINLIVLIKKEDILSTITIAGGSVPITSKIESNTKVLIKDGETLVIGGVLKKTEIESISGVPGLLKIPILGWLFKNTSTTEETTEIMIFITPKIVEKPA